MNPNLIVASFFLGVSISCMGISSSPELVCSEDALIERSWNIVWAKAVTAEVLNEEGRIAVKYGFEVIEVIRGNQKADFTLIGKRVSQHHELSTFKNHSEELFWSGAVGRINVEEDTEVIPCFSVGWTYLIFLDKPRHVKAFEEIGDKSDQWYLYVKKKVAEQKALGEEIRQAAMFRQIKFLIFEFLEKYPEIGETRRVKIINSSFEYVRDNPDATNDSIKHFFHEQVAVVMSDSSALRGVESGSGSEEINP